eukprot:scaffold8374_cov175-Amphora_coffeaeformis.AAC.113
MSQPYSPSKRETRIPTPSSKESRGSRGGSASPSRKIRSPASGGRFWSGKKPSTPKSNGSVIRRHARPDPADEEEQTQGCVGVSMDMLHTSMGTNAKAYEYLFDGIDDEESRETSDAKDTPWMSVINNLYQKHQQEKIRLKKDLRSAKQKSRHYKEELRDNLTERLKFLESKVLDQDSEISRVESSTTNTTQEGTSCSEGTIMNHQHQGMEAGNVEVVYATMSDQNVKKRVERLEQRLQQSNLAQKFEKEHWMQTLNEAAKATENGAELSKKVQGILEQVAADWNAMHRDELVAANKAKEHMEERLKELEQAHEVERAQWHNESARLKDDSRRLLRERNEYKGKFSRHREELEKSKAALTELERKVDLCQRQTSLAQKKATQWEEMASINQRSLSEHRQDPPSPVRPESLEHQLKRAMKERDAALKEAEETCKMLEDYQNRLERDRQSYNTKLKQAEEKHEIELEKRMTSFKNEFFEQFQNAPLSEVPHAELERRYRESVEKRNELANRMRQVQEQLSSEKGNWKLKLEGALSENRKLATDKENLKAQNENLRTQNALLDKQITALGNDQKSTRQNWENRLEQASKEWVERLSEIQDEHHREKEELKETMKKLQEYKENAEVLANETRKQLDQLKEKHRQDVLEWKEREVRTSQKSLFEAKEQYAVDIQTLHKEIARMENERIELEKSHLAQLDELQNKLQEEKENAEEIQDHHDKVIAEWEQHSTQLQGEKERLEAELKVMQEKAPYHDQRLAELQERVSELEAEKRHLLTEVEAASKKAEEMEQALDEVLDEHEEASAANHGLLEQFELEKEEWKQERDALEAQITELRQRADSIQTKVEKEVLEWKERLETAGIERDAAIEEAKTATESLANVKDLETRSTEREKHLRRLQEENRQLNEVFETHDAELNVWKRKSEKLEVDLKRAVEARNEDNQQAVERIESLEVENEQLRCQVNPADASWEEKYSDLLNEKERLEGLTEDQRRQLSEWTDKVGELESSWMRRIEQLRIELDDMEKAKDSQNRETNRIQKILESERDGREREVEDLKTERAKLQKARNAQKLKLEEMESQMKRMQKLNDEKEDEVINLRNRLSDLDQSIGLNTRVVAEMKALHAGEVEQLKEQVQSVRRECDAKVAQGRQDFEKEINEWKEKAESVKEEFQKQLERARSDHDDDSKALQQKLLRADEDIANFAKQTTKLTSSLDQLQRAHDEAKRHWQGEVNRIRTENERLQGLLQTHQEQHEHQNVWRAQTSSLQQHQHSISSLVEGIRGDVKSVKKLVQTSIEETKKDGAGPLTSFRGDLEGIRESLEETLSKMNHETEALLEHRDQMKALTEASTRADEAHQRFFEQQERLVSEIQLLRDNVSENGATDGSALVLDKVRLELVEELHRKETELARRCAEINHLNDELEIERAKRESAEREILTLNDQADAYGEELMRLQGINKTLEETMQDFDETMMKSGIEETPVARRDFDDRSIASDETSPMLDEALALAQSLTDLVHGSGSDEQETSVMVMLENISELMDQHDKGRAARPKSKKAKRNYGAVTVPTEVAICNRTRGELITRVEADHIETVLYPEDEDEPLPVTSPAGKPFFAEETSSRLHVVVNELYTRCHLLERERTQMMESTLELLQAARDANDAELQAAISTARRKSAEELLKVQEETQRGMWRMYNKLCSFCRDDVAVVDEEKKEIM